MTLIAILNNLATYQEKSQKTQKQRVNGYLQEGINLLVKALAEQWSYRDVDGTKWFEPMPLDIYVTLSNEGYLLPDELVTE